MSQKTINDLRAALFDTLEKVKNRSIDLDQARAINDIAKTLVDSAKVEVDYLRTTDGMESGFIAGNEQKSLPSGVTGRTVHRLR